MGLFFYKEKATAALRPDVIRRTDTFEKYSGNPRDRQGLIEEIIAGHEPDGEYVLLAHLVSSGLIKNTFTTNFDDLLNDALITYTNVKPKVYAHNEIAKYIRFNSDRPNIIKLHGDYLYENIKNINAETEELDSNLKEKFIEALSGQGLVVLGYGGADESIMSVLTALQRNIKFTLFWCGRDENRLHWRVIELIISSDDAYFVEVGTFEEFVFELYNSANIKIDINIVNKAKENQENMNQYLQEFQHKRLKRSHKLASVYFYDSLAPREGMDLLDRIKSGTLSRESAIQYYRILCELNDNPASLLNNYGATLLEERNFTQADQVFKNGLMKYHDNPWLWYNTGILDHDLDNLNDSYSGFKNALKFKSDLHEAFCNISTIDNKRKKFMDALSNINQALSIHQCAHYYINKGVYLKNLGNLKEAIENYDIAISMDGSMVRAYYNKGNVLRLMKKYDEAVHTCRFALNTSNNEYIYATLAQVYGEMNIDSEFYKNLQLALTRNYPLWRHINDRAYQRYRDQPRFQEMLKEYSPPSATY